MNALSRKLNSDCDEDDLRMEAGLSYYANFHPPPLGETELVVIPRQIKDVVLGFGLFGCQWAANSEDDIHEEASSDDEIHEEVEDA